MTAADDRAFLCTLGRRLLLIRTARGLSQAGVARKGRLDRTYVGRIERGRDNPTMTTVRRFAIALDVPLPTLLDETASPLDLLRVTGSDSRPAPRRR
jgi:transcriptional regulator with XRE-family HTH domain